MPPSAARLYRTLLRHARRAAPPERALWATTQIRTRFAQIRNDSARLADERSLRAEADDAVRFLKVVARQPIKDASDAAGRRTGVTRIAIDPLTGTVLNSSSSDSVSTTSSSSSSSSRAVFRDTRLTSDQVERHQRLLRRQHFMDRD